jgi:hypothetical protein
MCDARKKKCNVLLVSPVNYYYFFGFIHLYIYIIFPGPSKRRFLFINLLKNIYKCVSVV